MDQAAVPLFPTADSMCDNHGFFDKLLLTGKLRGLTEGGKSAADAASQMNNSRCP
jgi:hypothetical protein